MSAAVLDGDCLAVMPTLDAGSVDAIVTDPPYHLTTGKRGGTGSASDNPNSPAGRSRIGTGFMGKAWDGGDVAFRPETWAEALRVAKPGAHLVAFGGTRTFHRLTCAIEDGGWEIRDCLSWLYGSGFPKSHNISKAIDRENGDDREPDEYTGANEKNAVYGNKMGGGQTLARGPAASAASAASAAWDGWGTALKPAWEPIILARKPFPSTVAANVLEHGTGALNIGACRLKFASQEDKAAAAAAAAQRACQDQNKGRTAYGDFNNGPASLAPYLAKMDEGRWPANVALDEAAASLLDRQAPDVGGGTPREGGTPTSFAMKSGGAFGDSGGASRFFYTAKAASSERNAGLEGMASVRVKQSGHVDERVWDIPGSHAKPRANHHPTVKPLALMQWLCRLITPRGGLILDPFCGSGSTGRAAIAEGFRFVGIEMEPEYAVIARARIAEYAPLFTGGAA